MAANSTITISDLLLILVTFTGPITAVQAQKWIERTLQRKERRRSLFQTLMATRAVRAGSNDHVQALNLIELFFDGKSNKERMVRDAWAVYLDFLEQPAPVTESEAKAHNEKGVDYLIDLLKAMGSSLGYDFNDVKLKRGVYYPQGHADESLAQWTIREGLAKVLTGKSPIKIELVVPEDAIKTQQTLQNALSGVLAGETALKIRTEN